MRSRVWRWLFASFVLLGTLCQPQVSAAATGPSAVVKISDLKVATKSANKHVVSLSGLLTNTGNTTLTNASITLATSGPIYTRSQLGDVLANPQSVNGTAQPQFKVSLGTIDPGAPQVWKLRFTGETVLGSSASGVYAFGAMASTAQLTTSTYISAPWFYGSNQLTPTKLAIAVPLTTTNNHITTKAIRNVANDELALERLSQLVNTKQSKSLSWIVDPALKSWLKDLSSTQLREPATKFARQIARILNRSVLSPFGHANLAGLAVSNQGAEISNLIDYGNNIWPNHQTLYSSRSGNLSTETMNALILNSVTPMVSNAFSAGNPSVTSNAHSSIRSHDVVVFDQAASDCLNDRVTANNSFTQRMCLASEVGMMTAESPAVSRTVVVLAPTQWSISTQRLSSLIASLQGQKWVSLISLPQVLASNGRTQIEIPASATQKPISPRTLRLAKTLQHDIKVTASMVTNPQWKSTVTPARLLGYSDLWSSTSLAHAYLNGQLQSVRSIARNVTIQTSSRITIASTNAEIPITVANSSAQDVKIRVTLNSDTPGKFTAKPSPLVSVPVGKRVTVSVPITLAGTGVINATVELLAPNGQAVGASYDVRISSTAYQKVASTLVRIAFGILILLAISNFIRRRKKPVEERATAS
jgi:hypothetical protein